MASDIAITIPVDDEPYQVGKALSIIYRGTQYYIPLSAVTYWDGKFVEAKEWVLRQKGILE